MKVFDPECVHTITVAGEYAAIGGENGRHISKPYEHTFKLDDQTVKEHGALSTFLKVIADDELPKRYPDYIRCVTHEITRCESSTSPDKQPTDLTLMNREQMVAYIAKKRYQITPKFFKDNGALQQAIRDYEENPDAFAKQQELAEQRFKAGPDIDRVKALNAVKEPVAAGKGKSKKAEDDELGI